jgi:hypothetical protein
MGHLYTDFLLYTKMCIDLPACNHLQNKFFYYHPPHFYSDMHPVFNTIQKIFLFIPTWKKRNGNSI